MIPGKLDGALDTHSFLKTSLKSESCGILWGRFKINYFQLWFLCKSDLCIATAGRYIGISESELNNLAHIQYVLLYRSDQGSKVPW